MMLSGRGEWSEAGSAWHLGAVEGAAACIVCQARGGVLSGGPAWHLHACEAKSGCKRSNSRFTTTRLPAPSHTSGSQAPVASQKGAIVPLASTMGAAETPNSVPLVPRDTTSWPSLVTPGLGRV